VIEDGDGGVRVVSAEEARRYQAEHWQNATSLEERF